MTSIEPCQTCGSPVRLVQTRVRSQADERSERVDVRMCTNRACDTNSLEKSMADVV